MTGRLAAQQQPALGKRLRNVLVAHGRAEHGYPLPRKRAFQPRVGEHGRHDAVPFQLIAGAHILGGNVQNAVAVHDLPPFVHADTAVRIAVEGKS